VYLADTNKIMLHYTDACVRQFVVLVVLLSSFSD